MRRSGTKNRGYFFRKGRGWAATDGTPLTDAHGAKLREKTLSHATLTEAYARYRRTRIVTRSQSGPDLTTVCSDYLADCERNNATSTFEKRAGTLFDFCTGWPSRLRLKPDERTDESRIHQGYGSLLLSELTPATVSEWVAFHPSWKRGRRTNIQAIRRAVNWYCQQHNLGASPLKGIKIGSPGVRLTYITPKLQNQLLKAASPPLAMAIRICIRTGARYGCEYAILEARHVEVAGKKMRWRFPIEESKNRKHERVIYVADQRIVRTVQRLMKQHPTGPLFRDGTGEPWTRSRLKDAFRCLLRRLKVKESVSMYSCRHTFAKRTLTGYWTGKPINIDILARLMGNSRAVCLKHYAQWVTGFDEPLWSAVGD